MLLGTPPSCQVCLPALAIIVTWRAWPKGGEPVFCLFTCIVYEASQHRVEPCPAKKNVCLVHTGLASAASFTSTCCVSVVYMYFVLLQVCCCRVHMSMCKPPHYENPVHLLFPNPCTSVLVTVLWSQYFEQQQGLLPKICSDKATSEGVKPGTWGSYAVCCSSCNHAMMQNSADHVWRCLKEAVICMTMMMAIPCTQPLTWPQAHSD